MTPTEPSSDAETYDLVVAGGGAAGFFAAITFAESHPRARVVILEKSREVLGKAGRQEVRRRPGAGGRAGAGRRQAGQDLELSGQGGHVDAAGGPRLTQDLLLTLLGIQGHRSPTSTRSDTQPAPGPP